MHALDHPAFEPLGAAGRGGDQPLGAGDLLGAGGKGGMAGRDLLRVDEALAVKAQSPAFGRLGGEAFARPRGR